jgi:hypothetical protein
VLRFRKRTHSTDLKLNKYYGFRSMDHFWKLNKYSLFKYLIFNGFRSMDHFKWLVSIYKARELMVVDKVHDARRELKAALAGSPHFIHPHQLQHPVLLKAYLALIQAAP